MALIYAPLCSQCHQHRTRHPAGICSHCRKLKHSAPCRSCGEINTDHPSGLCHRCRSRGGGLQNLDRAIDHYEKTLYALKLLKDNISYKTIADIIGVSKSSIYTMCRNALHGPFYSEAEKEGEV